MVRCSSSKGDEKPRWMKLKKQSWSPLNPLKNSQRFVFLWVRTCRLPYGILRQTPHRAPTVCRSSAAPSSSGDVALSLPPSPQSLAILSPPPPLSSDLCVPRPLLVVALGVLLIYTPHLQTSMCFRFHKMIMIVIVTRTTRVIV